MAAAGDFREDLLYRLDVYNIHVPPLRERTDDIPLLADAFLAELSSEMGKHVKGFSGPALAALARHSWPGNVRELHNAVERSLLSCRGSEITPEDLPDMVRKGVVRGGVPEVDETVDLGDSGLDAWLEAAERRLIVQTLDQCQGVQAQAARLLGITERSLWHRVKKLDIRVDRAVRA
jgi:DNA-binding NtrC family response regulator